MDLWQISLISGALAAHLGPMAVDRDRCQPDKQTHAGNQHSADFEIPVLCRINPGKEQERRGNQAGDVPNPKPWMSRRVPGGEASPPSGSQPAETPSEIECRL
jgi:hypothetical protein